MLDVVGFWGLASLTLVTGLRFVDLAVVEADTLFSWSTATVVDPVMTYINE
jgi:hypothetical protein